MKRHLFILLFVLVVQGLSAQQHSAVDLGLPSGTLWADRNIGAESPNAYGDYFAWGEISGKDEYAFPTYRWGTSSKAITKYDGSLTELEQCDDPAYALWGEDWRTPSEQQIRELLANCTWSWEWSAADRTNVCTFVSRINGNSISFPACGGMWGSDRCCNGFFGSVWTRTLREDDPVYAKTLYMEITRTGKTPGFVGIPYSSRYSGHCIRPVRQ